MLLDDERSILHAYYSNSYLRQTKDKCEILMKFIEEKGLSHSDAEVVIWFSSAYKGTPEGQSAAKKHT